MEQSDTVPVGELGRCLGLDRIPAVKTLRHWANDKILQTLCDKLNETKTVFPSTDLAMKFKSVTS